MTAPVTKSTASIAIDFGAIARLPGMLGRARSVLLVTNRHLGLDARVLGPSVSAHTVTWRGEPSIEAIEAHAATCRPSRPDIVVGIGGGSVMDAAKALAAAIPNSEHPLIDHLEVVGSGRAFDHAPLPVIAVPTTAGTGSEMTKNAVLDIPSAKRKVSLRDPRLTPIGVVIDPTLAEGVPANVAAACALDASVQLVESYVTPLANDDSDRWALRGMQNGLTAATQVVAGRADTSVRMDIAVAAMCSGAALAASKLGTIHGFAGVLGGATGMGHGQLCGLFAGPVLRRTIDRLEEESPQHDSLERYRQLAAHAGQQANARELAEWFDGLIEQTDFSRDPIEALTASEREAVVAATEVASSTKGNPVALSRNDLHEILDEVART